MPTHVAVHTISFRGIAGAIFVLLSLATVLFVIGFATPSWAEIQSRSRFTRYSSRIGLWEQCSCGDISGSSKHVATQVVMSLALVCLLISFILICIYMCIHSVSKNSTLIALVVCCFLSVLFMLIGFCIFGDAYEKNVSWSFAVSVIAGILTLIAGILGIVQMRTAGVRL